MCITNRHLRMIVSLLLAGSLWACGGDKEKPIVEGVHAVNLENGETRDFDAENLVPAGWAVCELQDCSEVIARVRCSMLGPGACLLNGECRLRLRCDIDIPLWMRPADVTTAGDDRADPLPGGVTGGAQASYPVGCELICSEKRKISCEEIQNPDQCHAQQDCDWEEICYDEPATGHGSTGSSDPGQGGASDLRAPCSSDDPDCGYPMPPPPRPCTGVCRPSTPQPCEQLDNFACARRDDCQWLPEPLPLFDDESGEAAAEACPAPDCGMPLPRPYRSFCQPKQPACPEIAHVEPNCPRGSEIEPKYDEQGCLSGYRCVPTVCPTLDFIAPVCPDGQVAVREVDDRGCLVGMRCEPVGCDDVELPKPRCEDGSEPAPLRENGCLVGYECLPTCAAPVSKPYCDGKLQPIYRGQCLVGWTCSEPTDPRECEELFVSYKEALAAAKRCGVPSGTTTQGGADFAAPEWVGLCSMTVPSNLGCASCPTYVNPANQEAIAKLTRIRKAFEQGQCFRNRLCPAVMCLAPTGATCASGSDGNGVCTDSQRTY